MRGYWNNPEETARAFRDGKFRTGDVGYQDADGYFYILDRLKDMIVTGGEKRVQRRASRQSSTSHPVGSRSGGLRYYLTRNGANSSRPCIALKPGKLLTADQLIAHCRPISRQLQNPTAASSSGDRNCPRALRQDLKRILARALLLMNNARGNNQTVRTLIQGVTSGGQRLQSN
jgi:hypothetical protein